MFGAKGYDLKPSLPPCGITGKIQQTKVSNKEAKDRGTISFVGIRSFSHKPTTFFGMNMKARHMHINSSTVTMVVRCVSA